MNCFPNSLASPPLRRRFRPMVHKDSKVMFLFLFLLAPCLCQAITNTQKESIQVSINMASDDSGNGDRTYNISLATAASLPSNKSVSMEVHDVLCLEDNGGFVLLNNEMDYLNCNFSNPLHLFNSNDASYTFVNPGTFYIISLKADLCNDGAKLMIKVHERGSTFSPENPHQISSDSSSAAPSSVPNISNLMALMALMAEPRFWLIVCTTVALVGSTIFNG